MYDGNRRFGTYRNGRIGILRQRIWAYLARTSLFFAKHVIICEGASEKVFIDFLLNNEWIELKDKNIYILNSLGKFNIHIEREGISNLPLPFYNKVKRRKPKGRVLEGERT